MESLRIEVVTRAELRGWAPELLGRHQRLMLANPLGTEQGAVYLFAKSGDIQVGKVNAIEGEITHGGKKAPILWAAGLTVDESYRTTGAGLMLILKLQALHHTIAVIGVSRAALPLYRKLGWVDMSMDRYLLLYRSRPVWERVLGERATARAGAGLTDVALAVQRRMLAAWTRLRSRGLSVERTEKMGQECDELLAHSPEPLAIHRSGRWLNWLMSFSGRDSTRPQHLWLVRDARGRAVGYFIVTARHHAETGEVGFANFTLGSVKDWIVLDRQAIDERGLILLALRELAELSVDVAEVCVPDHTLGRRLRRMGLVKQGALAFLVKASPQSPLKSPIDFELSSWRVRPADGDHFYF